MFIDTSTLKKTRNTLEILTSRVKRLNEKSWREFRSYSSPEDYDLGKYVQARFKGEGFGSFPSTEERILNVYGHGEALDVLQLHGGRNLNEAFTRKYMDEYEASNMRQDFLRRKSFGPRRYKELELDGAFIDGGGGGGNNAEFSGASDGGDILNNDSFADDVDWFMKRRNKKQSMGNVTVPLSRKNAFNSSSSGFKVQNRNNDMQKLMNFVKMASELKNQKASAGSIAGDDGRDDNDNSGKVAIGKTIEASAPTPFINTIPMDDSEEVKRQRNSNVTRRNSGHRNTGIIFDPLSGTSRSEGDVISSSFAKQALESAKNDMVNASVDRLRLGENVQIERNKQRTYDAVFEMQDRDRQQKKDQYDQIIGNQGSSDDDDDDDDNNQGAVGLTSVIDMRRPR